MTLDILTWGLRMGVLISGLIGLVLLIRRPFARFFGAEATFLLWSLPVLRMCLPDFYLPIKKDIEVVSVNHLSVPDIDILAAQYLPVISQSSSMTDISAQPMGLFGLTGVDVIVCIWLMGGVIFLLYHLIRHMKFIGGLKSIATLPDPSLRVVTQDALRLAGLKRCPNIRVAPGAVGPLVSGLINPLVIVPHNFAEYYNNDAQRFALCHEFSHIKRRDLWWSFILLLFRSVYWYNPFVHYAARKFRLDQEAACDAYTLSRFSTAKFNQDSQDSRRRGDDTHDYAHGYAVTLLMCEQNSQNRTHKTHALAALSLAINTLPKTEDLMFTRRIHFTMSDPLTLSMTPGLTLGMGHPLTDRIRRLTMRKTNKFTRFGTYLVILGGLGLTTPILSNAAPTDPIIEAAQETLHEVVKEVLPPVTEFQNSTRLKFVEGSSTSPKFAEASAAPVPNVARAAKFAPMRLRMTPRFTTNQLEQIEKQRQAVVKAKDRQPVLKTLNDTFKSFHHLSRFQVTISDDGAGRVEIGHGGWPGYPVTNTGWLKRPLSPEMRRGLKSITEKCASASGPVYFEADMFEGDADLGKGRYEIECVPGTAYARRQITSIDLAKAYLASDDLPLERRQNNFQWMMGFAFMNDYVKNNPNATLADDRAACIRMNTELKTQYAFTDAHRKAKDHFLHRCHETDYNWVRKRENLPFAQ